MKVCIDMLITIRRMRSKKKKKKEKERKQESRRKNMKDYVVKRYYVHRKRQSGKVRIEIGNISTKMIIIDSQIIDIVKFDIGWVHLLIRVITEFKNVTGLIQSMLQRFSGWF